MKIFGGKKKEKTEPLKIKTELEQLCGEDKEVYEALVDTMFLDPRKVRTSMEEAAKKAKDFEKSGDALEASEWYHTAGGLAIYQGNIVKVKQFLEKCEELSSRKYPILKNPEKAIAKAQEYYQKYLK